MGTGTKWGNGWGHGLTGETAFVPPRKGKTAKGSVERGGGQPRRGHGV